MNNQVTITISTEDREAKLSFNQDGDIYNYLEEISHLLVAWGFHPSTVKDGICALSEQYEEEIKEDKSEGE
jgi:hypothetical protein